MDKIDWKVIIEKISELGSVWAVKLIGAIAILVIGKIVAGMLTSMTKSMMKRAKMDDTLVGFLGTIVHVVLQIVVWLMVLGNLGIQTTSFIAILGAAGLAIGLSLQGSLANFGAGVLLILFRPFKVGDFIEGAGAMGVVKEISIFTTTMTTGDNKLIIVPNAAMTGGNITNYSAMDTRRVDFVFGIGYDDDLRLAKTTLMEVVLADDRVLAEPAPMVVVSELADSSVNFTVRAWVKSADYWNVKFDVTEQVKLTFDAKGISIPYPQQDVHLYEKKQG